MDQSTSAPGDHPAFKIATSLGAPLILLGAAAAYCAGYVKRALSTGAYGLTLSAFEEPIQATMTAGYLAIIRLLAYTAIWEIALFGLPILVRSIFPKWLKQLRFRPFSIIGNAFDRIPDSYFFLALIPVVLTCSVVAGVLAGSLNVIKIDSSIQNGCAKCNLFNTSRGQVVGLILVQDAKRTAIVTRNGVAVLGTDTIKALRPINAHRRVPPAAEWFARVLP